MRARASRRGDGDEPLDPGGHDPRRGADRSAELLRGRRAVHVVNLDGVVNPDAYRARLHNDTQGYIKSRGIHWFADNQLFLTLVILELNSRPGHILDLRARPVRVRFTSRTLRAGEHSPCSSSASTIPRPDHRGPAWPQVAAAATAATSSSVGRKLTPPKLRCT